MKKALLMLLLTLPTLGFSQVVLGQIDDFQDFTNRNWTKINSTMPNTNIYDGGPMGAGDNFLRVVSGGSGEDLKLMTLNNAQWLGDYYKNNQSTRIKYITMDVRNSGTNIIFVRMSFKRYYASLGQTEIWSAINAVGVLPQQPWKKISFYIDESAFVRVSGLNPFTSTFSGVTEARILHNDVPSYNGASIVGTLDIDNIQASSQPLSTQDLQINSSVLLYPNPANEFIVVYSDRNENDNFEYKIVDILGRIVESGNSKINQEIDVKNLNSGNYIIQIKTENGEILNKKLAKK